MATQSHLFLERVISAAVGVQATSIHLTPGQKPVIRRGGMLEAFEEEDVVSTDVLRDVLDLVLSSEEKQKLEKERDVVSVFQGEGGRIKVHAYIQEGQPAVTLKPIVSLPLSVKDMGVPAAFLSWFEEPHGLILITGPHGSGRSTLAASLIEHINTRKRRRIITIEDPIEILLRDNKCIIEQREIGRDVPHWESAINSMFLEDVDVVFLGEVLSGKVAEGAVRIADKGALVLAVLDSVDTVTGVREWFDLWEGDDPTRFQQMTIDELIGVVGVRLLPRIGGGLVLATEVLPMTQAIKGAVADRNWNGARNLLATSRGEGTLSMSHALAELVRAGVVAQDIAEAYAADKDTLRQLL